MKKFFVFAGIALLMLASCQKSSVVDDRVVPSVTNPSLIDDSTNLVKFVDLDTTQAAPLDSLDLQTYTYDANKRVTAIDYYEFGAGGSRNSLSHTSMFYNGSDTLPFKKVTVATTLPSGTISFSDTSYYAYSAGRVVLDSILNGIYTPIIYRYTYETNRFLATIPGEPPFYVYLTRANGNTTLQKDTINGNPDNFAFTYDSKNNPFYGLPENPRPYYELELFAEDMVYEKNNPVDINQTEGPDNFHIVYTYQYRANDYPSISKYTDLSNGFVDKRLFFYTHL